VKPGTPSGTDRHVTTTALRAVQRGIAEAAEFTPGDPRVASILSLCQRVLARLVMVREHAEPGDGVSVDDATAAAAASSDRATLTVTRLQSYLDRRFPDARLRVLTCTDIAGGRSKLSSLVTLAPNSALPSELILRRDNPGSAQNTSVRDEFPAIQALFRAGVAAPDALWLESDASALGAPFFVMRRSAGAAPGDYWSSATVPPVLCLELARALAKLHRVATTLVWPHAMTAAADCVHEMIHAFELRLHGDSVTDSQTLQRGYQWIQAHLQCITGASVPVHGDVHFANVLASGDQINCLIDWEFAHAGHPAEDLAFCRSYIERILPWNDFMNSYLAAGGYAVSESQLQYFHIWTYLRNLTLATTILQDIQAGKISDLQNIVIALDARPRLEAALADALQSELARPTLV
jgi:aminoglycoside phosphotransferase (APT) family kinase protein